MKVHLSSPRWLRYGIAGGTVMFFGLAVLSLFAHEESGPFFVVVMVAFFSYMTYRGAILCRYINVEFELDGPNVRVRKGDAVQQFPLTGVRFKLEDWIQIVSVYDFSGNMVFAIDYMGQDINQLRQLIKDSDTLAANDR